MDERLHYLCRVRLNGTFLFVLWYSGERDGLARDESGLLLAADTPPALTALAEANGIAEVSHEQADYDFDRIRAWCADPKPIGVDCPEFLNAWNFFDDAAEQTEGAEAPRPRPTDRAEACYEKLFWGCNLPAVTPPGEWFAPEWRADELTEIRLVLEAGLAHFESELRAAGTIRGDRHR